MTITTSGAVAGRAPQWMSIQYLRAIAAVMVVLHHARNPEPWLYNPLAGLTFGQAGVDIFFVISGFIMYAAARDERPADFLYRRLIRVAPLYWCATLVALLVFYRPYLLAFDPRIITNLFLSLAFVPHANLAHPDQVWPLLVPGWTLCYEMFFYVIFAVALVRGRLVLPIVAAIIVAVVALGLVRPGTGAAWRTYTDPIVIEFVLGMLVARFLPLLTVRGAAALLLPVGFALLALTGEPGAWRVLQWGVPAVLVVVGALALEAHGRLPLHRALKALGDSSYSLYLVHPIVIAVTAKVVKALPLGGVAQFVAMIALCMGASIVAGLLVHRWAERPLLRALRGSRPPAVAAVG